MNTNECVCAVCGCSPEEAAEAREIQQILDAIPGDEPDMQAIPERVWQYWEKLDAQEALKHPGRTTEDWYEEGRLVKRVVTEVFTHAGEATSIEERATA